MKATLVLANGTKVEIDGGLDEVRRLLGDFSGATTSARTPASPATLSRATKRNPKSVARSDESADAGTVTELAIVNHIKEDEALQWAYGILDSKDTTRRVLLPLYVAAEIDSSAKGVTSGFISRVYAELGIRLDVGNVSTELSGRAKKYVLADSVRRKGAPVHYKISRTGRTLLEQSRNG